jgi:hypothetical protein
MEDKHKVESSYLEKFSAIESFCRTNTLQTWRKACEKKTLETPMKL